MTNSLLPLRLSSEPRRSAVKNSAMVAILVLGFLLRAVPLARNRAMEDEALYGYWGMQIASGTDPMLNREPVDKPPIFPYLLALTYWLYGPVRAGIAPSDDAPEIASLVGGPLICATDACGAETRQIEMESRLPSLFAGTIVIALLFSLARRLYDSTSIALLAALLLALSPYAVLFGPTAFVDPVLSLWVLAALLAAVANRPGLAGVLAGLALTTKQQGLLFLPLIALALLWGSHRSTRFRMPAPSSAPLLRSRRAWLPWLLFSLSLAAIVGAAFAWDQARDQRPGFLEQSFLSYGGLRGAAFSDLADRALAWCRLVAGFWASPWLNSLFAAALLTSALLTGSALWRRRQPKPSPPGSPGPVRLRGHGPVTLTTTLFVTLFLAAHWLIDVQLWDRYLLVIVPLVALVVARAIGLACRFLPPGRWQAACPPSLAVIVALSLATPLTWALKDRVAIGGDHGAYEGIDHLAAYAREHLPPGAVLYDHWLGYHYRFYLYGAPIHVHWYPDLTDLAEDALAYQKEPRYIALPSWRDDGEVTGALASAGIDLAPLYQARRRNNTISFRLYRLVGP